jgi:hypothetical protein
VTAARAYPVAAPLAVSLGIRPAAVHFGRLGAAIAVLHFMSRTVA